MQRFNPHRLHQVYFVCLMKPKGQTFHWILKWLVGVLNHSKEQLHYEKNNCLWLLDLKLLGWHRKAITGCCSKTSFPASMTHSASETKQFTKVESIWAWCLWWAKTHVWRAVEQEPWINPWQRTTTALVGNTHWMRQHTCESDIEMPQLGLSHASGSGNTLDAGGSLHN